MELSQGYCNLPAYFPTQTTFPGGSSIPSQPYIGVAHVAPNSNSTIVHENSFMTDPAGFFQQKKFVQKLYYAVSHDQTGAIQWNETGKIKWRKNLTRAIAFFKVTLLCWIMACFRCVIWFLNILNRRK